MRNTIRFTAVLAALSAAVASQALSLTYTGFGYVNALPSFGGDAPLSSLGLTDDFNFTSGYLDFSSATSGTVTLGSGADYLVISFAGSLQQTGGLQAVSAVGLVDGFGMYNQFDGQSVTVTTNTGTSFFIPGQGYTNFTTILGELTPVPEPTSMVALGIGAVGLLRRRAKKA